MLVAAAVLIGFACAFPHLSSAADPTSAQYCDGVGGGSSECQQVKGASASGSSGSGNSSGSVAAVSADSSGGGQLPFTGSDLGALVAIAVALMAGGVALVWVSGRRRRA
jgi:hypothetical protein